MAWEESMDLNVTFDRSANAAYVYLCEIGPGGEVRLQGNPIAGPPPPPLVGPDQPRRFSRVQPCRHPGRRASAVGSAAAGTPGPVT